MTCLPTQTCIVDENRQPSCQCDDNCTSTAFEPVCATDGQTYYNECSLKVEACKLKRELKVLFKGQCSEQSNSIDSCEKANCASYQQCTIDLNGRASCGCPTSNCPPIYSPVCANDGVTYDSICHLRKFSCESSKELIVLNYGVCGQQTLCDNHQCSLGSVCTINATTLQPICDCEQCSTEYAPVCADDGLTYRNPCWLKRASCTSQLERRPLYDGVCSGCLLHKCKHYSTCQINPTNGTAECVCLFDCEQQTNDTAMVCGSDRQLYASECELRKRACESKTELTIIPDLSICELCKQVFCKYGASCYNGKCVCPTDCPRDLYEPVCSNFGLTFTNECEFRKSACLNSRDPKTAAINYDKLENHTILFYGDCNKQHNDDEVKLIPVLAKSSILLSSHHQMIGSYMTMCNENTCKFGGKCFYNENGLPACLCSFDCGAHKGDPMACGSDGRLYLNDCKLQEEACIRQQKIDLLPMTNCLVNRGYSICNGTLPLVDKATGKFLDCNSRSLFFKECGSTNHTCLHHRKVIPSVTTLLTFKEQDHFCCAKNSVDQQQFSSLNELEVTGKQIEQQANRCDCNKLGSELPVKCDEKSKQCECKRGVMGVRCDRCQTGYYGFHKLSQGIDGCLPCNCNKNGSLREDCEQSIGACICRNYVSGLKCDACEAGKKLTSFGCVDEALLKVHNRKCSSSVRCRFGAVCKEVSPTKSQCVCNLSCRKRFEVNYQRRIVRDRSYLHEHYLDLSFLQNSQNSSGRVSRDKSKYLSRPICGSDRNSHLNECEMRISMCRMQRKIVKVKDGQCSATSAKELSSSESTGWPTTVTQTPVRRSTLEKEKDLYDAVDETSQTESSLNANLYTNLYEEQRPNFKPMFAGRSYIRLSRLETSAYLKLEIELIAFTDKGIIFYNSQSNSGVGDFISLTLNNGHFEYRFNLGSGVSTLRSREKVQKYQPTKVTLIKDFKRGVLIVNDRDEVSCTAEGNWKSLDLNENFFLGFVRSDHEKIYENLNNVRTGFVGCLLRLELGKSDKELKSVELASSNEISSEKATTSALSESRQSKMKILEYESIGNCSSLNRNTINFCQRYNPCSRHSVCANLNNNTFDCLCPVADQCVGTSKLDKPEPKAPLNPPANVYTLDFWGESYIKSRGILVNVARAFSIELWFMSRNKDGLLLYAQKTKKGDFLSLNVRDSRLEFTFDLGSKIPNVR